MPVSFKEKEPIAYRLLQSSLKNERVAQAYLFYGCGQRTSLDSAFDFASAILSGSHDLDRLDEELLRRMKEGTCADFFFLDGSKETIKTDDVKQMMSELQKTALETNGRQVYLIHQVQNSSEKVINQILKFIEETPGSNTFGLLTADTLSTVLPTVVSRCERIPFNGNDKKSRKDFYFEKGFDEEDAWLLSEILDDEQDISLNDSAFLAAKDLWIKTQECSNAESLIYNVYNDFFPTFVKEDKALLKTAFVYYLKMMIVYYRQYGSTQKDVVKKYENCCDCLSLTKGANDVRLLADRYLYGLLQIEREDAHD